MQIANTSNWPNLHTATNARLTALRNASNQVNTLVTLAEGGVNNITCEIRDTIGGTGAQFDMDQKKVLLGASDIVRNPRRNYGIANPTAAANLPALAISECAESVVYELLNWQAELDYKRYAQQMSDTTLRPWEKALAVSNREAQVTYDHAARMQALINAGEALSDFSTRNITNTAAYLANNDVQGYMALFSNGPHEVAPGGQVTKAAHLPTWQMYYFELFATFSNSSALGKQLKGLLQLAKAPYLAEAADKNAVAEVDNWLKKSEFSDGLDRAAYPHFWAVMVSVIKRIAALKSASFKLQSPFAEFSTDMWTLAKQHPVPKVRLDKIETELKKLLSTLRISTTIKITEGGAK